MSHTLVHLQTDLMLEIEHMGSQATPHQNEWVQSPVSSDGYTQRPPKKYSRDGQSSSHHESIDHSFRDPDRSERRSRSCERRSSLSASHRHVISHDLSPTDRGDIKRRGRPEWKSRSSADRDQERRTKEAEEYKISLGLKTTNPASRIRPHERNGRRDSPESNHFDRANTIGEQGQNSFPTSFSENNGRFTSPSYSPRLPDIMSVPSGRKEQTLGTKNLSSSSTCLRDDRLDDTEVANHSRDPPTRASPGGTVQLHDIVHAENLVIHTSEPEKEQTTYTNMVAISRAKITDALMRFMSEVTEQASLQLRSHSAKQALERRVMELEKVQRVHKDFASAAEAVQASKDRAQKEYDDLAQQLSKKKAESLSLVREIADSCVPNERDGRSQNPADVGEKIKKMENQIKNIESSIKLLRREHSDDRTDFGAVKSKQQELDQLFRASLKASETQINSIKATTGTILEGIQTKLRNFDTMLSKLATEVNEQTKNRELVNLKSKVDHLSTRVDSFPNLRIEVSKVTTEINTTLATQGQKIHELSSKVDETAKSFVKRVDDSTLGDLESKIIDLSTRVSCFPVEEVKQTIELQMQELQILRTLRAADFESRLNRATVEALSKVESTLVKITNHVRAVEKNLKVTDDKVGPEGLPRRVEKVEAELEKIRDNLRFLKEKSQLIESGPIQRTSPDPERSSTTRNAVDNELRLGFDKLQKELREELRKELRDTQFAGDEQWGRVINDFAGRITKFENSISALKGDYGEQLLGVSRDMDHMKESTSADITGLKDAVASNHSSLLAQHDTDRNMIQSLESKLNSLENLILTDIECVKLGVTNLDYRMNNLTTESLSKLILAQLEAHIRNNDASLPRLDLRIQTLEKSALSDRGNLHEKVRREIHGISDSAVQTAKNNLHETTQALETKLESLQAELTSLRAMKDDLSAMKTVSSETETKLKDFKDSITEVKGTLQDVASNLFESKTNFDKETTLLRAEIKVVDSSLGKVTKGFEASKASFAEETKSLRADIMNAAQQQVAQERRKLKSTGSTKANITQQRAATLEKRRLEGPTLTKANGRKRRKGLDSDNEDARLGDDDYDDAFAP